MYILCRCFARLQRETSRNLFSYTFYGGNVVRVLVQFFFSLPAHFHLALVATSISHFVAAATKFSCCSSNKKMSPLLFISRSKPLSPFFSLSFAGCRLLSLFLCLSPALYSKFVATREKKKLVPYVVMEKKKDDKRNAGDLKKKLSLKKIPFPSLFIFILIDRCPSRLSTMTATATSRNVNYLP